MCSYYLGIKLVSSLEIRGKKQKICGQTRSFHVVERVRIAVKIYKNVQICDVLVLPLFAKPPYMPQVHGKTGRCQSWLNVILESSYSQLLHYFCCSLSSILWTKYGILTNDTALCVVGVAGIVLQSIYLLFYYLNTRKKVSSINNIYTCSKYIL